MMDHLNKKLVFKICDRLWVANGSLKGLGGLFTQGTREMSFEDEEFYGVGQLLKSIGDELAILEDILRCGKDSTADKRNGVDDDDEEEEENDEDE